MTIRSLEAIEEEVARDRQKRATKRPSAYETFQERQQIAARIHRRTAPLLAMADEIVAKYKTREISQEEAIPPIGDLLSEIRRVYNFFLDAKQPEAKPFRRGMVYVVRGNGGLYKIGKTRQIKKRLKMIQIGSATPIKAVVVKRVGVRATQVEKHLHSLFAKQRVHGEWFALEDSTIGQIGPEIEKCLAEIKSSIGQQ